VISCEDTACLAPETTFPVPIRSNVSTPLPTNARGRRELTRRIQAFTRKRSLRMCGSTMATNDKRLDLETYWAPPHDVRVDLSDRGICFRGLFRCKSRHGCMYCARRTAAITQHEMLGVCRLFLEEHPQGSIGFLTATIPHRLHTALADSLDVVLKAWRAIRQGRLAKRLTALGMAGYIRALDVTYGGNNGWHPHIHALVLFEQTPSDLELAKLTTELYTRWNSYVQRAGFPPVRSERFQLERSRSVPDVSRYCAAASGTAEYSKIARELDVGLKLRWKGVSPAALYIKAAHGEDWALDKVHEFEDVAHGRKFVTWSKLAQQLRAKVEPLETDSEGEDDGLPAFYLPTWMYRRLRDMPGAFDILEVTLSIGVTSGKYLDYAGREVIEYERGSPAHTAHLWVASCYHRNNTTSVPHSRRVPAGAWSLVLDFLSVLCLELELVCSPFDWWMGKEWIST
jgi:hypothetical protein